jgi:hypothetical protein
MSTVPESSEPHPSIDPNWQVPDYPVEEIAESERNKLVDRFIALYEQIDRLDQLSLDPSKPTKASFHETYFTDAHANGRRLVLFSPKLRDDTERIFHIVVNDESIDSSDGMQLSIREFLVFPNTGTCPEIVRATNVLKKPHHVHGWHPDRTSGPLLQRRQDRLEVLTYKPIPLPKTLHHPAAQVIDLMEKTDATEDLSNVLRGLGSSTLEPHVKIVYF